MATTTLAEVGLVRSTLTLMWRSIVQFFRTPQMILITLVNGVIFVLIFRYVFGGAIKTGNETYVNLLVPAVMLVSVLYAASQIAVGVLLTASVAVNLAVGFAVGFRPNWTLEGALAAGGIAVGFAFTLAWMFVALGLLAKNAQAASGLGVLITPVAFISGAFVPVGTMPEWIEPVARNQPFSVLVEAARGLVLTNYADAADPLLAAAWLAAIFLVFAPLAIWLYSRT